MDTEILGLFLALLEEVKGEAIERSCEVMVGVVGDDYEITLLSDDMGDFFYIIDDVERFMQIFEVKVVDDKMGRVDAFWLVANEEYNVDGN